jgi:UDP-glucose 6-dehydrogenase
MKVAVLDLWHLGSVTAAACLASAGHEVTGWDPAAATVDRLSQGQPPIADDRADVESGRGHLSPFGVRHRLSAMPSVSR